MPIQPKLDLLLQINDEALKVQGELRQRVHAVRPRAEMLASSGVHIEQSLIRVVSELHGDVGRSRERQVLRPARAHHADGDGIRIRRAVSAARRSAAGGRGCRHAQGQAGDGRSEDADPPSVEPLAHHSRIGGPSDGTRSRARLRGQLRRHQLPHHRQAGQVRVRRRTSTSSATRPRIRRSPPAATTTTASRRRAGTSSGKACSSTTRRRASRRT